MFNRGLLKASIFAAQPKLFREKCAIRKAAKSSNFLYETNVGAGLPIIDTLKFLLATGDKIIKIEGVLSGTLSYIFNSFDNQSFSQIVKESKEKGLNEVIKNIKKK